MTDLGMRAGSYMPVSYNERIASLYGRRWQRTVESMHPDLRPEPMDLVDYFAQSEGTLLATADLMFETDNTPDGPGVELSTGYEFGHYSPKKSKARVTRKPRPLSVADEQRRQRAAKGFRPSRQQYVDYYRDRPAGCPHPQLYRMETNNFCTICCKPVYQEDSR